MLAEGLGVAVGGVGMIQPSVRFYFPGACKYFIGSSSNGRMHNVGLGLAVTIDITILAAIIKF